MYSVLQYVIRIYNGHLLTVGCASKEDFTALFPSRGQPAETPWRLALVLVFQFAEGLSDEQAAEAVRGRIDWKYALSLDVRLALSDSNVRARSKDQAR